MKGTARLKSPLAFSETLYQRMISINTGIRKMVLYEFRYALENLNPPDGWDSIQLVDQAEIEKRIGRREFYESIQLKPRVKNRIVLDQTIVTLTRMLMVGLVNGTYPEEWVNKLFYFDIRGFYFAPRTVYFTEVGLAHFGGKPYRCFEQRQKRFDDVQDIGYFDFQEANDVIDQAFIQLIQDLIKIRGVPILITLAGPTAAGKTEITERLLDVFERTGENTTSIEMDNFLKDREFRGGKPIDKTTIHFDLFKQGLRDIMLGKKITIPCYDFTDATSSHDVHGNLRPGHSTLWVEPGDIVFLEGNFPFHIPEIRDLIHIMIVYLTDDPIRLKRKWKRDVDYRKSYDPTHFRNRFFKTQFMRAEAIYRPLIETCDIVVDTTAAALWVTPEIGDLLDQN